MNAKQEQIVIFLHVPKAAGTTLYWVIERQYDPTVIYHFRWSHLPVDEFKKIPEAQREALRVLKGHMVFGLHEVVAGPSTYVTILRDPVDRVISHYYHVLQNPTHPLHSDVQRMSLKDYVCSGETTEINNGQTRRLSGVGATVGFGQCSAGMLKVAKQNLQEHFAVVGLAERFDETLLLLKRALGWGLPFYVKRHVGKNRPRTARKDNLSEDALNSIENYNELDIELYRYAREMFAERIRQQGPSFERELKAFKLLNKAFWVYIFPSRAANKIKALGRKFDHK